MSETAKELVNIISGHASAAFKNPSGRWGVFFAVLFLSIPFDRFPDWLDSARPVFQAGVIAMIAYPAAAFIIQKLQRRSVIRELRKLGRDEVQILREYISYGRACHYIRVLTNAPALSLHIKGILVCPITQYLMHSCPMILRPEIRDCLVAHPEIVGLTVEEIGKSPFKNLEPDPYAYPDSPQS